MLSVAERRRHPCRAQPCQRHGLLQAVQTRAGTFGVAAFATTQSRRQGPTRARSTEESMLNMHFLQGPSSAKVNFQRVLQRMQY